MKILVVDDNQVNIRLLVSMLTRRNFQVLTASNGYDAIEVFKQEIPNIVLMDIMMPGMDGRECASKLKQIAGDIYIPVIFVTALSEEAALSAALASGGDDFVSKPINFDILLSKINAHSRIQELNNELSLKNKQLARYNFRLERDQELAAYFFERALKHSYLDPGIIRHHLSPKSAFNGDLFMASPRPGGGIYVILGDFTGHGLGASIGSLPVAQVFYSMTNEGYWIGDIASELNRELRNLLPHDMFLAATLVELNSSGERLEIWAGGLPDAYLIDSDQDSQRLIKSGHLPLGILCDDAFNPATEFFTVRHGERLFLYTDGVIEARNTAGETYGSERLHNLIVKHGIEAFGHIIGDIQSFTGDGRQSDDTSFIGLICQPVNATVKAPPENEHTTAIKPSAPYTISLKLSDAELKNEVDVVSYLSNMICANHFKNQKGLVHTILAEIYSNMIEHGLLQLDSVQKYNDHGFQAYYDQKRAMLARAMNLAIDIRISFHPEPVPGKLIISMTHNGKSSNEYSDSNPIDTGTKLHGRGMLLLENLCEEVYIHDQGREIEVVYRF